MVGGHLEVRQIERPFKALAWQALPVADDMPRGMARRPDTQPVRGPQADPVPEPAPAIRTGDLDRAGLVAQGVAQFAQQFASQQARRSTP